MALNKDSDVEELLTEAENAMVRGEWDYAKACLNSAEKKERERGTIADEE